MDEKENDALILEGAEGILKGWDAHAPAMRLRRLVTLGLISEQAFGIAPRPATEDYWREVDRKLAKLRLVKT